MVQQQDFEATLASGTRAKQARGACADHDDIELRHAPIVAACPGRLSQARSRLLIQSQFAARGVHRIARGLFCSHGTTSALALGFLQGLIGPLSGFQQ